MLLWHVQKLWSNNFNFTMIKKFHTCDEGGAHLRISFWHLLMNLKKKKLLKKLLKWANKKQNNFNV